MSVRNTLQGHWRPEFDKHSLATALRKHFDHALDVAERIEAKRAEIGANRSLSALGQQQELQKYAATEAPELAKARRAIATASKNIEAQRLALLPSVSDPTDVRAALLRQEARNLLRSKSQAEAVAMLFDPNADDLFAEAVFEAPGMSGVSADVRDRLLNTTLERKSGPAVAALQTQSEAVELTQAALNTSLDRLRTAAGLEPREFEQWFTKAAPADDKAIADEAAKFNEAVAEQSANALPLKQRMSLVDRLIATNTDEVRAA